MEWILAMSVLANVVLLGAVVLATAETRWWVRHHVRELGDRPCIVEQRRDESRQ